MAAWGAGARLYAVNGPSGGTEFIPVKNLRDRYPPIPLKETEFSFVEPDGARSVLMAALKRKSSSARLNLLLSQCFYLEGDRQKAHNHYRAAESADPGLARKYSYPIGGAGGGLSPAVENRGEGTDGVTRGASATGEQSLFCEE